MHDHPDLETLPIILGILKDCIKSTQPGIEAAESKVKFWELCESLVYQKGEIIVRLLGVTFLRIVLTFLRIWISMMRVELLFTRALSQDALAPRQGFLLVAGPS